MAKRKGANWEILLSSKISLWLSQGKNDFLCYRSSGSGALSTVRAKHGRCAAEHSGDLASTHPFSAPFCNMVSVEAKRGYNNVSPHDLLDMPEKSKTNIYAGFIAQCVREMEEGGKESFWLIHKRDRREATITMPYAFMQKYFNLFGDFRPISFRFTYNDIKLISCKLDDFLGWFKPEMVFGEFKE